MRMQNTVLNQPNATCLLVEVIAKQSQDKVWIVSLDGQSVQHPQIRRVSIDQFYALVTGEQNAFAQLCAALPQLIDDVLADYQNDILIQNTVLDELNTHSSKDLLKNIYHSAFSSYLGFKDFQWHN